MNNFTTIMAGVASLTIGTLCAIVSVTMLVVLKNEPILNWWFRFGETVGKYEKDKREAERWFYKPIWGCEKCFAGQLAFWFYIFSCLHMEAYCKPIPPEGGVPFPAWQITKFVLEGYNPLGHIGAICTAILLAVFLSYKINQSK